MVASIGKIASPSQGVSYYERDGYYSKDDPAHREASAWAGKGAEELGFSGPVDPDTFRAILEGRVPGGRQLGRKDPDGSIHHRPGRDVTLSAPKSVSVMALVGGDERIVAAHDRAVGKTLAWIEPNAIETRMQDKATGAMVRTGGQKMVAATFRHDASRNLDPQLHTHAVIANMAQGGDGKWRTTVDDGLYAGKMAIGAIYRAELAEGLRELGYGIERTHPDGRFEIAGISRDVIEAFSTRRAEIEAAMEERGLGNSGENPHLAARAALMTRAHKRDVDKEELRRSWERQARELGFSAAIVRAKARKVERELPAPDLFADRGNEAGDATSWAVEHLSERQAVFGHVDLLAAALGREPGKVTVGGAERAIAALEERGGLHAATGLGHGRHWTTDAALARESETIALMQAGKGSGKAIMRGWIATTRLHRGRLNEGQKEAVRMILASTDRVVGVQGYAGTGKTTMLDRLRALLESRGYRTMGLAPSASAARTLERESGIGSETLQRFLAQHAGIGEGRGAPKGLRGLRASFSKTVLVVDESSLASSEQMRGLLRVATTLRVPRVVLVGDEKQLGAVEAGKPFEQLRRAGMKTAVMDEILRQRDKELKEAVRAGLAGEVKTAFEKLGERIAQVDREEIGAAAARRWLSLSPDQRAITGVIAPTRALRDEINETIRAQLISEGAVSGPARQVEKLIPRDLTRAEMARASSYSVGDTVISNRKYKTLGVDKGDQREVLRVDQKYNVVWLGTEKGDPVAWRPHLIAAAKGGVEVYRSEEMELRPGDRVRWTRNDPGSGLANGETAVVKSVEKDGVRFGLEDGSTARLAGEDPQLRHLDRGWASTIHAFQGRTVDGIIAAMPTGNPDLTNQRAFYVAISRARDDAELVTDDAWKLSDQLERATGERVSALDGAAKEAAHEAIFGVERPGGRDRDPAEKEQAALDPDKPDRGIDSGDGHEVEREHDRQQQETLEPIKTPLEMDLEL
ncbi:MAG: relaxase domain-containing protein [Deltaproteobacteria bacterium]|nr:relaxase domain-containing protein [Deltaproteobacteria bacterium]